MADKALRGNKLTKELKALSTGIRKIGEGLDRSKFKKEKDPRGTGEISLRKKIYGGDPRKGKK